MHTMRRLIKLCEAETVDPEQEFNTWLAAQPWHEQVNVSLRRSFLEPNDLYVDYMNTERAKGQGLGRAILAKLIEISDRHQIPLTLEASEESPDSDWLQEWYERHGFEYHDNGYGEYGPYMIRDPVRRM